MKKPTKGELIGIGCKINLSIQSVWKLGPTIKEMETLETYIRQQETILPLLDPTFIARHGFSSLDQAKRRIELLKPILELREKEKKGKCCQGKTPSTASSSISKAIVVLTGFTPNARNARR